MRPACPDKGEIADYLAAMLDELLELSRPLQDAKLMSLLSISAELARCHMTEQEGIPENPSFPYVWDQILPARRRLPARR